MKAPDKVYWSYLAGLFDGEGTFSIYQNNGNYHVTVTGEEKQYNFTNHRVEITNTNVDLMEWLIQHFGGKYYLHRRAKIVHKPAYSWRPSGKKNTEALILGILPYLVIKKKQANIVLQYIRLGQSCGTERRDVEARRALMLQCQALNKRGFSVETNMLDGVTPPGETLKREPDLTGDCESDPDVSQGAGTTAHIIGCACGFCKTGFTKP